MAAEGARTLRSASRYFLYNCVLFRVAIIERGAARQEGKEESFQSDLLSPFRSQIRGEEQALEVTGTPT